MEDNNNENPIIKDEYEIERELQKGIWRIRFSPHIEKAFLNYFLKKYIWRIRFAVSLGVFLYAAVGILDPFVAPSSKEILWTIRWAVVLPLGLSFLLLTYRIKKEWLIQVLHALLVVISGVGVVAMMMFISPEEDFFYQAGFMSIVFYTYALSQLRFPYALFTSFTTTFLYLMGDYGIVQNSTKGLLEGAFFLTLANLIGIPVSYLWEYQLRKDFLLTERLTIEKRKTEQLNKVLKDLSYVDDLTGIPNRRRFKEYLKKEWERSKRTKRPISILMVDIDFFKNYNDSFGHLAGDECLRRVAEAMSKNLRKEIDLVARCGGEEFVVILPEVDASQARKVAERIRQAVLNLNIPNPGSETSGKITVSVGVASTVPQEGMSEESLVETADKALYTAKREGRNKVVCKEIKS